MSRNFDFSQAANTGVTVLPDLTLSTPHAGDVLSVLSVTAGQAQLTFSAPTGGSAGDFLPLTGGTLTGPLILAANPTDANGAATKDYVDTKASATLGTVSANYLTLSGGTLTGTLILPAATPTNPTQATTKDYVDTKVTTSLGAYLPLAGGTLTGMLSLPATTPTNPTHAVSKAYVDAQIASAGASVVVADTPPATPSPGDMWFDSVNAQLFLRYADADSAQWVVANNVGAAESSGVASFNTRVGAVTLASLDVTNALAYTPYSNANPSGYQTAAQVATAVAPALNNVGRNLLHNALFNVAQRGAGPWTTTTSFTVDRWQIAFVLDTLSTTQGTLSDAQRTSIGDEAAAFSVMNVFTGNAGASAQSYISQNIEDVRRLAGKTVTLSFWAVASDALKLGVNYWQVFGAGGSPTVYPVNATGQSATLSTTWTRYSLTTTIPSIVGKTVGTNSDHFTGVAFFFSAGATSNAAAGNIGVQSGTVQLWGVQLEVGSVATPLEKPDPQVDLANCQRFFWTGQVLAQGTSTVAYAAATSITMPVTPRAAPTIVVTTNADANLTGPTQQYLPGGVLAFSGLTPASTTGWAINRIFTASADL